MNEMNEIIKNRMNCKNRNEIMNIMNEMNEIIKNRMKY